jgi:hypothetical protein
MNCKTCKYWNLECCYAAPDDSGYHDCTHPKVFYDQFRLNSYPSDGAAYSDYESYAAGFSTGPDFGCVLHEPK